MKFFLILLFPVSLFFLIACKQYKKDKIATTTITSDTANYFPIHSFIEEQSRFIDLRNFNIVRTITQLNSTKKDTLTKEVFFAELSNFKDLATSFNTQKQYYKETVFQDLGTESYTLNYKSTKPDLPIQRIDILLRAETNTVKQLFARCVYQRNDSSITRQFSFTADKKMEVSTEYSINNNMPIREIRLIEWTKE
jgi:hypothetical protein